MARPLGMGALGPQSNPAKSSASASRNLSTRPSRRVAVPRPCASASPMSPLSSPSLSIDVKEGDKNVTIHLQGPSQAGLLCSLTSAFISLGLDVNKADITEKDGAVDNMFQVAKEDGTTVSDEDVAVIRQTLESLLASASSSSATRSRPKLRVRGAAEGNKGELLHELMDTYSTDSVLSIQRAIINHVEYTLARSRYVALRCVALHCIESIRRPPAVWIFPQLDRDRGRHPRSLDQSYHVT